MTPVQNQIVYLMFLNGVLFLGLNYIAHSLVFPAPPGSKRLGYVLIVTASLAFVVTQEHRLLMGLKFTQEEARNVILGGFALPIFLGSLVYHRIKKYRLEKIPPRQKTED
ncbi:MAG: hypothetical protein ACE5ER_02575 [Nitrospinaceae bacterium]